MQSEKKQWLIFLTLGFILLNVWGMFFSIQARAQTGLINNSTPQTSAVQDGGILASPFEVSFNYTQSKELSMNLLFQNVTDSGSFYAQGPNYILNGSHVSGSFSIFGANNYEYVKDAMIWYDNVTLKWYFDSLKTTIPLEKIPDANIQFIVTFNLKLDPSRKSTEIRSVVIPHRITFNYEISKTGNKLSVFIDSVFSTYRGDRPDGNVNGTVANIHEYTVKKINESTEFMKGNLSYQESTKSWIAAVDLTGKIGDFYIIITFGISELSQNFTSSTSPDSKNQFSRQADISDYSLYLIIAAAVVVTLLIASFIKAARKSKETLERKSTTGQKSKPIEIVEISKAELKRSKIGSVPTQKKVKKVDKSGLIFDVPTWEVDETEAETTPETTEAPEVPQTPSYGTKPSVSFGAKTPVTSAPIAPVTPPKKVIAPVSSDYTLHCSSCNSWFEVEQYMKIDCPKCNAPLNVAMWCTGCKKWFDIPEPGDYNCPKCSKKLQYTKS